MSLKPKQSGKTSMGIVWKVRVRKKINTPRRYKKDDSFVIFLYFLLCKAKILRIKAYLKIGFVSLTFKIKHDFLNIFKTIRQICCTGLLPCSKLVHSDSNELVFLLQNLVPSLMNLFLFSKTNNKFWQTD